MSQDLFDESGLQIKNLNDIITDKVNSYKSIYGDDINVDSNTKDGQIINIESQAAEDIRELLLDINSGFDPDQASGITLDQRVAINGLKRRGGTFTYQNIDMVFDKAVDLQGLDDQLKEISPTNNPYTIKDNAGNQFYLLESQSIVGAESDTFMFRAKDMGVIEVLLNTITTPVTIIAGVVSVNNSSAVTTKGTNEELDAELKDRRKKSTSLSATSYLDSIESALQNLDGVISAYCYENNTDEIDSNGTLPHYIWAIVEGGNPKDIATVLYSKKSSGSGMRGIQNYDITRPNGSIWRAYWDEPSDEDLYIQFSISLPNGVIDEDDIKNKIVENIIWIVGKDANACVITAYLLSLNSKYVVTAMQVSDDGLNWYETVSPSSPLYRFTNSVTNITIL